jgi:hypothetical protein
MASTRNLGIAELRGHQYVTGSAAPLMERGSTTRRGMETAQEIAEKAASTVATAAEGIFGRLIHTIRRRPLMTLLVGTGIGLAAVAVFGSRSARDRTRG